MSTRQRGRAITMLLQMCENTGKLVDPLEEFQSALILAYERAIDRGVSPTVALAAILELTSSEILRWHTPPR
jgi:hypothetical protein